MAVATPMHRIAPVNAGTDSEVPLRNSIHTIPASAAGSAVLIYLLIVVNFQSWADPFVIITALPAALAGIVWMLFLSGTSLSVPALTGAILCIAVRKTALTFQPI